MYRFVVKHNAQTWAVDAGSVAELTVWAKGVWSVLDTFFGANPLHSLQLEAWTHRVGADGRVLVSHPTAKGERYPGCRVFGIDSSDSLVNAAVWGVELITDFEWSVEHEADK